MATRILSGFLKPTADHRKGGKARIDFHTHSVSGDATAVDKQSIGPHEKFTGRPCKIIALRQIRFVDYDNSVAHECHGSDLNAFNLGEDFDPTGTVYVDISWEAVGRGAEIEEISYLFIGDA